MKVFLDTNVWLSATVFAGLCEDIVVQCAERGWLVSSLLVQKEAYDVLQRKFASQPQSCDLFDAAWRSAALIADVAEPVDDNDMRLVKAVVLAEGDFFVTGDKRVLGWAQSAPTASSLGKLRIVSPREAWVALFGAADLH